MNPKSNLVTAGILGGTAVILGALGAHALKSVLEPAQIESFETAVRYQMWHALALLALANWAGKIKRFRLISRLWLIGVILFSGSIYLLSIDELLQLKLSFLGPITPLGGLSMIAGWALLVSGTLSKSEETN